MYQLLKICVGENTQYLSLQSVTDTEYSRKDWLASLLPNKEKKDKNPSLKQF